MHGRDWRNPAHRCNGEHWIVDRDRLLRHERFDRVTSAVARIVMVARDYRVRGIIVCGSLALVLMLLGVVVAIMNMSIHRPRDRGFGLAYRRTTFGGG